MRKKAPTIRYTEKHSAWVRFAHWANFLLLSLMLWSGILIYWANDVYEPFFPKAFYRTFNLHHHLALGMAVHFTAMWLFLVNGLIYFIYLLFSGEWKEIIPKRNTFKDAVKVTLFDLGLSKSSPSQGKLNAAQKIAYSGVLLMAVGSILSGLAMYKPVQLHSLVAVFGGYEGARLVHFILFLGYFVFFVIHVAQVIRAGWNNFRAMVAGFEELK
jgi:thiosulfate reductase cytochrome b subunit